MAEMSSVSKAFTDSNAGKIIIEIFGVFEKRRSPPSEIIFALHGVLAMCAVKFGCPLETVLSDMRAAYADAEELQRTGTLTEKKKAD